MAGFNAGERESHDGTLPQRAQPAQLEKRGDEGIPLIILNESHPETWTERLLRDAVLVCSATYPTFFSPIRDSRRLDFLSS